MSTARKILIVDDDEDLREPLREQLALHDEFTLTTADTAAECIERCKSDHWDLVILDVGLPDMDGREAVKLLRKVNAEVVAAAFVIDLPDLGGCKRLDALGIPCHTLIAFEGD